ncbi:MAG TPA: glycosyltransferase family 39 protein [Gaiellaceae bacterium]|nr:glycosyltransferase family 39 protein [Gaiellaceae bacterium]
MLAGRQAASGARDGPAPDAERPEGPLRRRLDGYRLGVAAITGALAAFFLLRLHALPSHEDETLAFFVSRQPLGDLLDTVLGDRGGAPLHYLLGHAALQVYEGLTSLRLISAAFAVASMPLVAALVAWLAGRRAALLATLVTAASWVTIYHGIYARMYSLFLFASALSLLLLLRALERSTAGRWTAWAVATLALLATQPYGALVLAAQAVFVAVLRLRRPLPLRAPLTAFAAVVALAAPLWRTYLVLASRFEVGLGERASRLGSPGDVLRYLWDVVGDFTAATPLIALPAALLFALGVAVLARDRPETAILTGALVVVPTIALMAARSGGGTALESRHLIFLLPFFAMGLAVGLLRVAEATGRAGPAVLAAGLGALLAAQVAWGLDRTPWLYRGEPDERTEARAEAAEWLAATGRGDDVLFGYEPTYLDAWEQGAPFGSTFVPRADAKLAVRVLESAGPVLGRGVWVLDASDELDRARVRLEIPERRPGVGFEAQAFGPFLVVRTEAPTETPERFLAATLAVQELGFELDIGDSGRNALTAREGLRELGFAVGDG